MLQGYKTYIVAAVAILTALLGYFGHQLTLLQALQAIGLAVGLGGNRLLLRAAAVLNSPYSGAIGVPDASARAWTIYAGVALTILTAALAYLDGSQSLVATIAAVLSALGLNTLGVGVKKVSDGKIS